MVIIRNGGNFLIINNNQMDLIYNWIVYITVNTVNNKTYIGVHKTTQNNFDGYIGCGVDITRPSTYKKSKTAFQYAVNKYGVDKFSRSTLFTFDNELDAYNKESELVTIEYVKNPNTYNLIVGGRLNTNHANQYKEVHMYNIHGEYIKSFETVTEANKFINPGAKSGGHISSNIRKGNLTKKYQFSYEKLPYMKEYEKKKIERSDEYREMLRIRQSKPVGRYSIDGELIETFPSLKSCRLAGYTNAQAVIENRRKHCKGYVFKYL